MDRNIENIKWMFGPFVKDEKPVFEPTSATSYICPIRNEQICWESANVYNPAIIVKDGLLHMFYRADSLYNHEVDDCGNRKMVCCIGHAVSRDGIHFERYSEPVLFPDKDEYEQFEWWGGCQDLHIVEDENGRYYMNYTAWTGQLDYRTGAFGAKPEEPWEDVLLIAVSEDLIHWKKCGPALKEKWKQYYNHSRSGVVISRICEDKLIAEKINGKYYMYFAHEGILASSEDLISWDLEVDENGIPKKLFPYKKLTAEEKQTYDFGSHEAGAAAIMTDQGIVYFYNASGIVDGLGVCWSQGQALISKEDLLTVIDKAEEPVFAPEHPWEKMGHTSEPCVVCNTIVKWNGQWCMYYGAADHVIGRVHTE